MICLWCGTKIKKPVESYNFCQNCYENLEELEAVTTRCNLTEQAEVILSQSN